MNEINLGSQLQDSERPEPKSALGGSDAGKPQGSTRATVSIISYRTRLLDKDNLFRGSKSLLDALKYAGAIPGDSEKEIEFEAVQIKVAHHSEERTVIELSIPD